MLAASMAVSLPASHSQLLSSVLYTENMTSFIRLQVIIYQKRDILDMFGNIYPYSVFQTTSVPKMNMSNYWERRSIYHRLGPYGDLDEIDGQKCLLCDFYAAVPKRK